MAEHAAVDFRDYAMEGRSSDGGDGGPFRDFRAGLSQDRLDVLHDCLERLHVEHPQVLAVIGGPARVLAFLHRHRFKAAAAEAALTADLRWREKMGIFSPATDAEGSSELSVEEQAGSSLSSENGKSSPAKEDAEAGESTGTIGKQKHGFAHIIREYIISSNPNCMKPTAPPQFPVGELEMLGCPLLIPWV